MEETALSEYRFSFGDSCVAVSERLGTVDEPARVLFFLHGRFGDSRIWRPVLRSLDPRLHCVLVDLPGFGKSFSSRERGLSLVELADLIVELSRRFAGRAREQVFVGHDIGGTIAQMAAVSLKRCGGLVLIDCPGFGEHERHGPRLLTASLISTFLRWKLNRLVRSSRSFNREAEEILLDPWIRRDSRVSMTRAIRAIESSWPGPFERQAWKKGVRNLQAPVMVLWGSEDGLVPSSAASRILHEVPDASFYESSKTGHWPPLEQPQWVSEKIQELVFKMPGRGAAAS